MKSQKNTLWIVFVVVLVFGALFFRNELASFVGGVGSVSKDGNKVYTDESLDIAFQYPKYLTVEVIRPENTRALKRFRVYDKSYVAPADTTGQTVRSQLREANIDAYPNTNEDWEDAVNSVIRETGRATTYEKDLIIHETTAMTLVGPYTTVIKRIGGSILVGRAVNAHKELLINVMNSATSTALSN